ncbi:MAG: hypothetical protein JSS57_13065 [Proteobacteria bacterium]|nr:hypothetical protein [Pseudomonadota bacterium]
MNTPMQFPSSSDTLYELTDSANAMALTDQLTARLAQLHAMLSACSLLMNDWPLESHSISVDCPRDL